MTVYKAQNKEICYTCNHPITHAEPGFEIWMNGEYEIIHNTCLEKLLDTEKQ